MPTRADDVRLGKSPLGAKEFHGGRFIDDWLSRTSCPGAKVSVTCIGLVVGLITVGEKKQLQLTKGMLHDNVTG